MRRFRSCKVLSSHLKEQSTVWRTGGGGPFALAGATGGTANLPAWIKGNIIPLLLLIAVMLFVFAQRVANAKAMRVVAGVVVALGVASSGRADEGDTRLASLVTATLATRNNLASLLEESSRVEEAVEQLRMLLQDQQRVLGAGHAEP